MALPNLLEVSTINGRTAFANVTTTLANVLVNPASSGNSFRIVNIMAASIDTSNTGNVNINVLRTGVNNYLGFGLSVPSRSTLLVVGKENPVNLEEGDALQMSADANNKIWATIVYEDIR